MLKPCSHARLVRSPLLGHRTALLPGHRAGTGSFIRPASTRKAVAGGGVRCAVPGEAKQAVTARRADSATKVKVSVSVQPTLTGFLTNLSFTRGLDDIGDLLGRSLYLELVSTDLDPAVT